MKIQKFSYLFFAEWFYQMVEHSNSFFCLNFLKMLAPLTSDFHERHRKFPIGANLIVSFGKTNFSDLFTIQLAVRSRMHFSSSGAIGF